MSCSYFFISDGDSDFPYYICGLLMNRKIIYTIILFLTGLICCHAQEEKKFIKGFSGGMMAHTGYMFGGDNPYGYNPKGIGNDTY